MNDSLHQNGMTIFEYNCSNIIVLVLCIIALCFVIYKIIKKFNKSDSFDRITEAMIIGIAVAVFSISSLFVWETNSQFQEGTVTEYIRMGSIGDFIVNYTFYIVDEEGNELVYNAPIISGKKYIKKLESVNSGDQIRIEYGEKFNYAFDIEKIE